MKLRKTDPTLRNSLRHSIKIFTSLLLVVASLSQISAPANAATAQSKPRYVNFDSTDGTGCYKWSDQLVSSEPNLSPRLPSYLGKKATRVPCENRHHLETFVKLTSSKYSKLGKPFSKVTKYCQKVFASKKKTIESATPDIQILYINSAEGTRAYFCTIVEASYLDGANTDYQVYKESIKPILKINMGK